MIVLDILFNTKCLNGSEIKRQIADYFFDSIWFFNISVIKFDFFMKFWKSLFLQLTEKSFDTEFANKQVKKDFSSIYNLLIFYYQFRQIVHGNGTSFYNALTKLVLVLQ